MKLSQRYTLHHCHFSWKTLAKDFYLAKRFSSWLPWDVSIIKLRRRLKHAWSIHRGTKLHSLLLVADADGKGTLFDYFSIFAEPHKTWFHPPTKLRKVIITSSSGRDSVDCSCWQRNLSGTTAESPMVRTMIIVVQRIGVPTIGLPAVILVMLLSHQQCS